MAHRLITNTLVANACVREERYIIHDKQLKGFRLEIQPTGKKTYRIDSRYNGERLYESIGDATAMPLSEARRIAAERLAAFGNTKHDANTPFEIVAEIAFNHRARLWKPATMSTNRKLLDNKLLPHFRGVPIGNITRADVEGWFGKLSGSPGSANRTLPILSGIMRTAEDMGFIEEGSNPASGFRRYKMKPKERYLNRDEMVRLGKLLTEREHEFPMPVAFIRFMAFTGSRRGELMNLKWDYYTDGHLYLPDSKTGPKTIFLSSPARRLLAELSRNSNSQWVFSVNNDPPKPSHIDTFWRDIRRDADIADMRMHDLRHTYASIAIQSGENLRVLGMLLGHVEAETTLRYAHLDDTNMHKAVQKITNSMYRRTRR